jgi:hypothetical protein
MSGMSGRGRAKPLTPFRHQVRVFHISGYTGDVLVWRDVSILGVVLLPKRPTLGMVTRSVWEVPGERLAIDDRRLVMER